MTPLLTPGERGWPQHVCSLRSFGFINGGGIATLEIGVRRQASLASTGSMPNLRTSGSCCDLIVSDPRALRRKKQWPMRPTSVRAPMLGNGP